MDPYRIDPNLREDRKEKILTKNSKVLIGYCNQIFDCILNSFNWCPEHFRNIFEYIQQALIRKFPEDEAVRYRGPNGFIFLRFFFVQQLQAQRILIYFKIILLLMLQEI